MTPSRLGRDQSPEVCVVRSVLRAATKHVQCECGKGHSSAALRSLWFLRAEDAFTRSRLRRTESRPAVRSTSDQRRPSSSPRRKPVAIAMAHPVSKICFRHIAYHGTSNLHHKNIFAVGATDRVSNVRCDPSFGGMECSLHACARARWRGGVGLRAGVSYLAGGKAKKIILPSGARDSWGCALLGSAQ